MDRTPTTVIAEMIMSQSVIQNTHALKGGSTVFYDLSRPTVDLGVATLYKIWPIPTFGGPASCSVAPDDEEPVYQPVSNSLTKVQGVEEENVT